MLTALSLFQALHPAFYFQHSKQSQFAPLNVSVHSLKLFLGDFRTILRVVFFQIFSRSSFTVLLPGPCCRISASLKASSMCSVHLNASRLPTWFFSDLLPVADEQRHQTNNKSRLPTINDQKVQMLSPLWRFHKLILKSSSCLAIHSLLFIFLLSFSLFVFSFDFVPRGFFLIIFFIVFFLLILSLTVLFQLFYCFLEIDSSFF